VARGHSAIRPFRAQVIAEVPTALGPVSHETIFTLYGGQFSELFAYTLLNCLWKLNPKQYRFDAFEFRNYLNSEQDKRSRSE